MIDQTASTSGIPDKKLHLTTRDTTYPMVNVNEFSLSQLSSGSISSRNDEDIYPIDPNNPGILLIINQAEFYTEPDPKYEVSKLYK